MRNAQRQAVADVHVPASRCALDVGSTGAAHLTPLRVQHQHEIADQPHYFPPVGDGKKPGLPLPFCLRFPPVRNPRTPATRALVAGVAAFGFGDVMTGIDGRALTGLHSLGV